MGVFSQASGNACSFCHKACKTESSLPEIVKELEQPSGGPRQSCPAILSETLNVL